MTFKETRLICGICVLMATLTVAVFTFNIFAAAIVGLDPTARDRIF